MISDDKLKENSLTNIQNKIYNLKTIKSLQDISDKEKDLLLGYNMPFEEDRINIKFVDENYRRRGIGSKLIKFSMDNARFIHKDAYFSLHVMVTNENALNLYKKLGFKITKTIPDFYLWLIPEGGKREEGKNYDGYEMEYHFD